MSKKNFSPLLFLASLGAGGISVIPFAFLNYTHTHAGSLINISDIDLAALSGLDSATMYLLFAVMAVFPVIHILLSVKFFAQLIGYRKTSEYKEMMANPLTNASIMAPFISIVMTMNVFIGPVRFFWVWFAENLQLFMAPALAFWAIIWIFEMYTEIKLLKTSFSADFDVNKIHFGWLLHPFALGMLSVTGAGIAALSTNVEIANIAAFMTLVSGTMGFFLFIVKLIAIFKSHFAAKGLPEKQFLPSFLIIVPNITLYAITAFRLGHYAEHVHGFEMGAFFMIVMLTAFAFETWYLLFGLSLLGDYLKKHFNKEYYVSQWGLVCPVVAYAVLGSFVHKVFIQSEILYWVIIATMLVSVVLFFALFRKMCSCKREKGKYSCA